MIRLLASRRVWPLTLAQATGAVNDNLVKNAMLVLALFQLHAGATGLSAVAGALFIGPYILLSAPAGTLADRFPKPRLIVIYKLAEVVLMIVAAASFLFASIPMLLALLLCLGVQAALFGPAKYGVLPEYLAGADLLAGNGITEAATFVAIVCGTVAGGGLIQLQAGPFVVGAVGIGLSLVGLIGALCMPVLPPANPRLPLRINILAETWQVIRLAMHHRVVWRCILAISWFWTIGATVLTELPIIVRDTIQADGSALTVLLAAFAVGVGIGSIGCTRLLHGRISARLTPIAGVGMTLFCWEFAHAAVSATHLRSVWLEPTGWRLLFDLTALAACGGIYSVPLYAVIQEAAPADARSRIVAANNIMNALFMVIGAAAAGIAAGYGLSASQVLQGAAAINMVAAAIIWIGLSSSHAAHG